MKEILYYVLKYEDRYYAPYQDMAIFEAGWSSPTLESLTTTNKKLAVRFGGQEIANAMRDEELRQRSHEKSFDPSKCRIVRVVRKTPSVH